MLKRLREGSVHVDFAQPPAPARPHPHPGDLGPVLGRDDDDLVWTAERSHGVMSGASARSSMFINFSVLAVDTAVTAVS